MCDWSSDVCSSDLSFPQELSITAGGLDRWSRPLQKSGIAEMPNALARMVRVPTVYCDVKAITVYQHCGGVRWVGRSDERRAGQVCVRKCRSRWWPYH